MKLILLIAFYIFGFSTSFSQQISKELISSSGNIDSNEQYHLTWTLGDSFTETYSNSEGILEQGFLHTNNIVVSLNETQTDVFRIDVYPNPIKDFIYVAYRNNINIELKYSITDITGRVVSRGTIRGRKDDIVQIDFTNKTTGTYIITFKSKQYRKSFQMIKN